MQIRVALKDWDEILKFQQDLINAQHFDAAYIFRRLRLDRAFHFTAMPKLVCYLKEIVFQNEKFCFIVRKVPQSPESGKSVISFPILEKRLLGLPWWSSG